MIVKRLADFVPERLTQARRVRGWSMAELAGRITPALTRQAIFSFEKASSSPSPETLRALAQELEVEPTFLTAPLRLRESEKALESAITFRSLLSSSKKAREQAKVYLEWFAGLGEFVEQLVDLPPVAIPDFGIDDFASLNDDQIDNLAAKSRKFLGLGDGPISDLTLLLENKGVFVGYINLAQGMDGISAWISGRPVVLISENAYCARARFDVAHELAHLVLHRALTNEELSAKGMLALVEHQAQHFASCFLMPETTFAREIYGVDEQSLIAAKKRWGVSMQAIIMRLNAIGLLSDYQKIRAFQQISAKGQRKKEPLDDTTEPERGRLLKKVTEFMRENRILELSDFFDKAKYPLWFLEAVTGLRAAISTNSNVVPFKLKAAG